jgi:hypothetical protein
MHSSQYEGANLYTPTTTLASRSSNIVPDTQEETIPDITMSPSTSAKDKPAVVCVLYI